jgi:hypothetical protein
MSTSSVIYTGLSVDFATNLSHADFRKADDFIEKHPELDEYAYNLCDDDEAEGKLVLICDGMNGHYLRLIQIDKCCNDGYTTYGNVVIELPMPSISDELIDKFKALHKEYTGEDLPPEKLRYIVWTHWT